MSFRLRLALAVGALTAVAIALTGFLATRSASEELHGEVDAFLRLRVEQLEALDLTRAARGRRGPELTPGSLDLADAVTQLLDRRGEVLRPGQTALPVSRVDRLIANGGTRSNLVTVDVDGVTYRVITAPLPLGAVQIGRDLHEVNDALDAMARRTWFVGGAFTALAMASAWFLVSRLTRPIRALSAAAQKIADTQDLTMAVPDSGDDEVARLGSSFNTMLVALDTSRSQQERLVADASHEMRTPLTSIRTNVDILARADLAEADRAEVLNDVSSELEELTSLVAEMVHLASGQGQQTEAIVTTSLVDLARSVAERFSRRSGSKIDVVVGTDRLVDVRLALIDRAISNLVDNAIKFGRDPRTAATAMAGKNAESGVRGGSGSAVEIVVDDGHVMVRDFGPGIDSKEAAAMFDRFYRSDDARSKPGSGLGLAIVNQIVRAHGGKVFARNRDDGLGSEFGFALP